MKRLSFKILFACLFVAGICLSARCADVKVSDPSPDPARLPGKMFMLVRTCGMEALSENLFKVLTRINRGESSDPIGGEIAAGELYAGGRKLPSDKGEHTIQRLPLLMTVLCKIPVDRLPFVADIDGRLEFTFYLDGKDGVRGVCLLPITKFSELRSLWRKDELMRLVVEDLVDGTVAINDPRYGELYLADLGGRGVLAARSRASLQLALKHYRKWDAFVDSFDGDVHVRFAVQKYLKYLKVGENGTSIPETHMFGEGLIPRFVRAILQIPGAISDALPSMLSDIDFITSDVSLTGLGVEVRSEFQALKDTPTFKLLKTASDAPAGYPLLAAMPENTVAFFSFASGEKAREFIEPVIISSAYERSKNIAGHSHEALYLGLKSTLNAARGEICIAFVRGKVHDVNLLLAFQAESRDAARDYAESLRPHCGGLVDVVVDESLVLVGVGLERKQLLLDLRDHIDSKSKRFATGTNALDRLLSKDAAARHAVAGVYPVNLVKGLIGELVVMMQLSGLPLQMRNMLSRVNLEAADSPNPFFVGLGSDKGKGVVCASLPLGGAMDVARLLDKYMRSFDGVNAMTPELYFRQWILNLEKEVFPKIVPQLKKAKESFSGKKDSEGESPAE